MSTLLDLAPEVADALAAGRPVVALESTIIAHGMAYPVNVETALEVERLIRAEQAVPATIAVIAGRLRVGLSAGEIDRVGAAGTSMAKLSARDLAYAAARKLDGATTVAATMQVASLAGIAVFATGGIGGVHRGAAETFDISADLTELAQTPVAVVSAGAKAILDLPLTLEFLETLSVPVIGFGTDEFPAFYSRSSGLSLTMRGDTAAEIATFLDARWQLDRRGGVLIANPIPVSDEIAIAEITPVIVAAIDEAKRKGIAGKAVTPFLLAQLAQATAGRSVTANIALVKNNARVAAKIASAYASRISPDRA